MGLEKNSWIGKSLENKKEVFFWIPWSIQNSFVLFFFGHCNPNDRLGVTFQKLKYWGGHYKNDGRGLNVVNPFCFFFCVLTTFMFAVCISSKKKMFAVCICLLLHYFYVAYSMHLLFSWTSSLLVIPLLSFVSIIKLLLMLAFISVINRAAAIASWYGWWPWFATSAEAAAIF